MIRELVFSCLVGTYKLELKLKWVAPFIFPLPNSMIFFKEMEQNEVRDRKSDRDNTETLKKTTNKYSENEKRTQCHQME